MINTVVYWEVWDNFSEDGRGPNSNKTIACFNNEHNANLFAQDSGNYGGKARVAKRTVHICETKQEVKQVEHRRSIEAALNKLTPEDMKLLNIVDPYSEKE